MSNGRDSWLGKETMRWVPFLSNTEWIPKQMRSRGGGCLFGTGWIQGLHQQLRRKSSQVAPLGPSGLRWVMRQVPSPVVIVSTTADGQSRGTTCSSFTSVSLDPPIVSICLRRPSSTIALLQASKTFAIHLLSDSMQAQSIAFASPKTQTDFTQFPSYIHSSFHEIPLPILKGCLAVLICSTERQVTVGDHDVFYGCVEQVLRESEGGDICSPDETEPKPLLYYKSSYRSIGDQLFMEAFESGELEFWTHTEHLRMAWTYLRDSGSKELALPLIRNGIQHFNQVNASKLNTGGTRDMVHEKEEDFDGFMSRTGDVFGEWKMIYTYYSKERLESGRMHFKEPDLKPMPKSWSQLTRKGNGDM